MEVAFSSRNEIFCKHRDGLPLRHGSSTNSVKLPSTPAHGKCSEAWVSSQAGTPQCTTGCDCDFPLKTGQVCGVASPKDLENGEHMPKAILPSIAGKSPPNTTNMNKDRPCDQGEPSDPGQTIPVALGNLNTTQNHGEQTSPVDLGSAVMHTQA